ncbi:hypothetical protein Venkman_gp38 [Methylophilales phage Venkman EXVC282S]|nr:hypothetical protein Venkman_gp38 [Methylophilales phage Venkman EXVC282S]
MLNASMSYKDRNKGNNFAEDFFEEYCKDYYIARLGFDEKNNSIPLFYNINPILRNMPDYFVYANKKTFVCNVKGTANIKQKEINILPNIAIAYNSKDCPLIYAFCFKGNKFPIFKSYQEVIDLYMNETNKQWNDGKIYRTLSL